MSPLGLRTQRAAVILVAIGLVARLAAITWFAVEPTSDAQALENLGWNLASGRGYTVNGIVDTVWPPGTPALIALVYKSVGRSVFAFTVLQTIFDLIACTLLWLWTRKRFSEPVPMITLTLAVLSISAIAVVRVTRGECLGAVVLVLSLLLFDLSRDSRRWVLLLSGCGFCLAMLTFVRWNFSLIPLFLVALLLIRPWPLSRRLTGAALMLTVYALLLMPWLLRNKAIVGEAVLSTQSGTTLYSSHFRNSGEPYGLNTVDETTVRASKMKPLERSRFLVDQTVHRLREDPAHLFKQYPEKVFWLLQPFDWEVIAPRFLNFTYLIVFVFSLVGWQQSWSADRHLTLLLVAPLFYLILLSFPFYGSPRFRLPAEPLLCPIAAHGIAKLVTRIRELRRTGLRQSA